MIKVIEGYKVRNGTNMLPILKRLWSYAMTFPGFMGAESLLSDKDNSIIAEQSTWESPEHWRTLETSPLRQEILQEAETLLMEKPRVTIYKVVPIRG